MNLTTQNQENPRKQNQENPRKKEDTVVGYARSALDILQLTPIPYGCGGLMLYLQGRRPALR